MSNKKILVGLDIGTTKICAIAGSFNRDLNPPEFSQIEIIGFTTSAYRGQKKGVIENLEVTVETVKKVIREASRQSGCQLDSVYIGSTCACGSSDFIVKCLNQANLKIVEICLEPLASAEAVLLPKEKEQGVALVDLGGSTSDIAVYKNNELVHCGMVSLGGVQITNDLAIGLDRSLGEAEQLKIERGSCLLQEGYREFIQPRTEEILCLCREEFQKSNFSKYLSAGVVLTGGTALLNGILEFGELVFDMPVRRGYPLVEGMGMAERLNSPVYSTCLGLVKHGFHSVSQGDSDVPGNLFYNKVRNTMRAWVKELF